MASYRPPVTRSRLHQHTLFQAERLKLQGIVKENIAAVKALLEIDSDNTDVCLLYTSPSPRDGLLSRMPSSA